MVRCRYVDSVLIQVTGPKSVLPEPKTGTGRMSMTWIHFLNTICGLQLETRSDYFICNSSYTITSEGGWTASLNDTIKPFIEKFTRKRSLYCVRLHTGQIPDSSVNSNTSSATATTTRDSDTNTNDTTQPWMPTILGKSTPKMKTTPVKKFASTVPMKPSQWTSPSSQIGSSSTSHSTLSTGNVVELPTPVLRIPIRGCPAGASSDTSPQQSVTAAQLFQKLDGKAVQAKARRNPFSGSSNKTKNKHIPEFSLRIASGRSKNSFVSVPEPSPPKLSRFDEVGMSSAPAEPQPGPSKPPSNAARSSSPRKSSRSSSSPLKRRYGEKDGMNGSGAEGGSNCSKNISDSRTLAAIKQEAIEIDLVELDESDEEEEEQQGNGFDQRFLHQNERSILGILGILGDHGEDDDNASSPTTPASGEIADLASRIERKMDDFDNSMLHKIKQEIEKLVQNKKWERNVKRSPMACYLLQELFKD